MRCIDRQRSSIKSKVVVVVVTFLLLLLVMVPHTVVFSSSLLLLRQRSCGAATFLFRGGSRRRRTTGSTLHPSSFWRYPVQPHHNSRGIFFSYSTTTTRRFLASRRSSSVTWQVGDAVLVDTHKDQSKLIPGVIEEIKKAGWYSVRLGRGEVDDEIQNVRKSQLMIVNTNDCSINSDDTSAATVDLSSTIPKDKIPLQDPVQARPTALAINGGEDTRYPLDSSENPPPPPPRMDDLDALLRGGLQQTDLNHHAAKNTTHREYLQQCQHHASIQKWVVFTDLHCAPSTLDTSLQVLKTVHQLAQDRQAGILFLGDFWHHRGTLRVDCLNAVLEELQDWTVPMILIPGNHDQVTLGGHSHGLTPLTNAYRVSTNDNTTVPGPLVFSHPTLLAGALFVPHVRDIAILESILQSTMATTQAKAIFVHADVTGSYMNDMIVSTGGVHPSVFPPNKPIYSGHFHKPHTVTSRKDNVAIEYLGSPYETSLAEARQAKALAVLDSDWKCIERIAVAIGRKHYKPYSVDQLMGLRIDGSSTVHKTTTMVRKGDRIVATLSRGEIIELEQDEHAEDHIRQLRKAGVAVEVREAEVENLDAALSSRDEQPNLEDLSPTNMWEQFWDEQVQRGLFDSEMKTELHEAGLELLQEIDEDEKESRGSTLPTAAAAINLQFDSISVEGYGPFPNRVEYPLNNRGLVLLRGSNLDGGSDR